MGKWSNLTNIFQMGWNHKLVYYYVILAYAIFAFVMYIQFRIACIMYMSDVICCHMSCHTSPRHKTILDLGDLELTVHSHDMTGRCPKYDWPLGDMRKGLVRGQGRWPLVFFGGFLSGTQSKPRFLVGCYFIHVLFLCESDSTPQRGTQDVFMITTHISWWLVLLFLGLGHMPWIMGLVGTANECNAVLMIHVMYSQVYFICNLQWLNREPQMNCSSMFCFDTACLLQIGGS